MRFWNGFRVGTAAALVIGAVSTASADQVFHFSELQTGSQPAGSAPYATLNIVDSGANEVTLTLTNNMTGEPQSFITELLLNLTGIPLDLGATPLDQQVSTVSWGSNSFHDAGLDFDLQVNYHTTNAGGGIKRLNVGESASVKLTGTGLSSNSFMSEADGNTSGILAMIHVQGLGANGEDSGKLTAVPEPASMAILGIGLAGLIARRRKTA